MLLNLLLVLLPTLLCRLPLILKVKSDALAANADS